MGWRCSGEEKWTVNIEDETTALQLYDDLVLSRHVIKLDDYKVDDFYRFCKYISQREKMEDWQLREWILQWIMHDSRAKRQYLLADDRYKLVDALVELVPT